MHEIITGKCWANIAISQQWNIKMILNYTENKITDVSEFHIIDL